VIGVTGPALMITVTAEGATMITEIFLGVEDEVGEEATIRVEAAALGVEADITTIILRDFEAEAAGEVIVQILTEVDLLGTGEKQ